ncbi:MAG: WbqC family protein [Prevotella sp.]
MPEVLTEQNGKALLAATYFGPVQWYQKLNRFGQCLVEQYEHFVKQTYRNRCVIATANGAQTLSVPIESTGGKDGKVLMRDVRISDHGNWRHLHWNALLSAYGESPFFEFYADDIRPFFEKKWTFLLDFDMEITETLCNLLDVRPDIGLTGSFTPIKKQGEEDAGLLPLADFRETIRPKHPLADSAFQPRAYYQVYARKHGFLPNMSVLDLLFNMGNEAIFYL